MHEFNTLLHYMNNVAFHLKYVAVATRTQLPFVLSLRCTSRCHPHNSLVSYITRPSHRCSAWAPWRTPCVRCPGTCTSPISCWWLPTSCWSCGPRPERRIRRSLKDPLRSFYSYLSRVVWFFSRDGVCIDWQRVVNAVGFHCSWRYMLFLYMHIWVDTKGRTVRGRCNFLL